MKRALALLIAVLPLPAAAHPHIFIDVGFEVMVDEQSRFAAIRVTWVYDEYYTLLITEDLHIDQDFDGVLTPEEETRLSGFDTNWDPGFNGDLVATLNGAQLELSRPLEPKATIKDGRIVSTHMRQVGGKPALSGSTLSLMPYDPTYYSAYDVTMPVTISGQITCMIELVKPDIDDTLAAMRDQLLRIDANADPEENDFPMVGEEFATDVRFSCPGS